MSTEQAVDPAVPSLAALIDRQRQLVTSCQDRYHRDPQHLAIAVDKLATLERLAAELAAGEQHRDRGPSVVA